jgi:hypothetical protein
VHFHKAWTAHQSGRDINAAAALALDSKKSLSISYFLKELAAVNPDGPSERHAGDIFDSQQGHVSFPITRFHPFPLLRFIRTDNQCIRPKAPSETGGHGQSRTLNLTPFRPAEYLQCGFSDP